MLGWDITDYGLGDFDKVGMSLITTRSGGISSVPEYEEIKKELNRFDL